MAGSGGACRPCRRSCPIYYNNVEEVKKIKGKQSSLLTRILMLFHRVPGIFRNSPNGQITHSKTHWKYLQSLEDIQIPCLEILKGHLTPKINNSLLV